MKRGRRVQEEEGDWSRGREEQGCRELRKKGGDDKDRDNREE